MSEDGTCSKCDAPILWCATVNGKMQPIDFEPNPAGNMRLSGNYRQTDRGTLPEVVVIRKAELEAEKLQLLETPPDRSDRYMPHHATCPNADEFRRPKKAS